MLFRDGAIEEARVHKMQELLDTKVLPFCKRRDAPASRFVRRREGVSKLTALGLACTKGVTIENANCKGGATNQSPTVPSSRCTSLSRSQAFQWGWRRGFGRLVAGVAKT